MSFDKIAEIDLSHRVNGTHFYIPVGRPVHLLTTAVPHRVDVCSGAEGPLVRLSLHSTPRMFYEMSVLQPGQFTLAVNGDEMFIHFRVM